MINEDELVKFLQWYWREIHGKPYQTTADEIVKFYLEDNEKENK